MLRRSVIGLGLSQLICWGISFYLIGVFGDLIIADLGWSRMLVHGGFSAALLVMALVSPYVGRSIDQLGGGRIMAAGSILLAAGCAGLAAAHTIAAYYGAWICLGVAMRCALYDAAFATLARIYGPAAGRPIAQITLLGGLAATCFWPIGHAIAEALGWRGALGIYAIFALVTLPLHLTLPKARFSEETLQRTNVDSVLPVPAGDRKIVPALLYALTITLVNTLNAGMSAHMISLLIELGLGASLAVTVSSLRGIGQTAARLTDVLFGSRLHPVDLNLIASGALPVSFILGLASAGYLTAAFGFSLGYGVGNGLATITRGTLPLVLFDYRIYGGFVGKLLVPGFIASAGSPVLFAYVIEQFGAKAAFILSIIISGLILVAAIGLKLIQKKSSS